MNHEYSFFEFTLYTLAPVHIGCGESISKKEMVYEKGVYHYLDMGKLYLDIESMGSKKVQKFTNYMLNNNRESLLKFLKDERINYQKYVVEKRKEYIFSTQNSDKGKVKNIEKMVSDAYGNPYIPGSSLKGAIRTILVNEVFKTDDNSIINARYVENISDGHDLFNQIRVSDSLPIKKDKLVIAQKIDYNKFKSEENPINLYRESIAPLNIITFNITCTSVYAAQLIRQLPELAKKHYEHYFQHFLSEFSKTYIGKNPGLSTIYIGGGTGFWTKTYINKANPSRHKRGGRTRMVEKGVLKLTKSIKENRLINNDEQLFEMGLCAFKIKEIKK